MLNKVFLIADTHFNHKKIIDYCKRPFDSIEEMNEVLIKNWNEKVSSNDLVIHIGDFGFGSFEELKQVFDRLNGIKYLVMGNHDLRGGYKFYKDLGFEKVYKKEFQFGIYVFSHKPKKIDDGYINIYGHIHNSLIPKEFDDDKHICISVERINYAPIKLEELLEDSNNEKIY